MKKHDYTKWLAYTFAVWCVTLSVVLAADRVRSPKSVQTSGTNKTMRPASPTPPVVKQIAPTKTQTSTELRASSIALVRPQLKDQRPVVTVAWEAVNTNRLARWLLRVGHSSGNWTMVSELSATNRSITGLIESPWKVYVFNVCSVDLSGLESPAYDKNAEVYWHLPTNGLVWNESGKARFSFFQPAGKSVNISSGDFPGRWSKGTLYTSAVSNAVVMYEVPAQTQQYFTIDRF